MLKVNSAEVKITVRPLAGILLGIFQGGGGGGEIHVLALGKANT